MTLEAEFDLDSALVELGQLLLSTPATERYLEQVASLARQVFGPPATCGVTLYLDGAPVTVAKSGQIAGQVEETQYEAGAGPCLHALRTGEVVDLPDLRTEERWAEYRAHALALGLGSTYTVPLTAGEQVIGALNLHAAGAHAFDDQARRALRLFAAQASAALTLLQRDTAQRALGEQLQEALESRAVIDQAMGIVMATRRCDAEQAFAFLRRTSQNANRKLRVVAADLVTAASTGLPSPRGGGAAPSPRGPAPR